MKKTITKKISTLWMFGLVLALALSACAPAPTPAPTQDVALIQTQAAQTVVADLTQNAPPPTQAPPPTAAPTEAAPPPGPTPDPNIPVAVVPTPAPGEPAAIANYNTTIFSGPGTNYVVYSTILEGYTAKVVGKSEDGLWWAVSVPVAPTGNGWVDAAWVTVSNADGVAVLPTPPVPRPSSLSRPARMTRKPRRSRMCTCVPARPRIFLPMALPHLARMPGCSARVKTVNGGSCVSIQRIYPLAMAG